MNSKNEEIVNILKAINKGENPLTGEIIGLEELYLDDEYLQEVLILYKNASKHYPKNMVSGILKRESLNLLCRNTDAIYEELANWRTEMAKELKMSPFCFVTNKVLENIASSDVCKIEDLLEVKGISYQSFDNWGEDIFDILKDYIKPGDYEKYIRKLYKTSKERK